jgi:predicted GIY-YIG superfamily endonuclease
MTVSIYAGFVADGRVGYVGKSKDYQRRILEHAKHSIWAPAIVRWAVLKEVTADEARVEEDRAIAKLEPLFNKVQTSRGVNVAWRNIEEQLALVGVSLEVSA